MSHPILSTFPSVITFERLGGRHSRFSWEFVAYRAPLEGEHYLCGDHPIAYRASRGFTARYAVVRPVDEFVPHRNAWKKVEPADA